MSIFFKLSFFFVFNFYLFGFCSGQTIPLKVDSLAKQKTEYIKILLKLDESQFNKWLGLENKYLMSIDTLQSIGRNFDSYTRKERAMLMSKEYEVGVVKILTKEQLELYMNRKQLTKAELESKLKEFKIPVNN